MGLQLPNISKQHTNRIGAGRFLKNNEKIMFTIIMNKIL